MRDITVKLVDNEFGKVCEVRIDGGDPIASIEEPESMAGENYNESMMEWVLECIIEDAEQKYNATDEEKALIEDKVPKFFQSLKPMSQRHKDSILRDMLDGVDSVVATLSNREKDSE